MTSLSADPRSQTFTFFFQAHWSADRSVELLEAGPVSSTHTEAQPQFIAQARKVNALRARR